METAPTVMKLAVMENGGASETQWCQGDRVSVTGNKHFQESRNGSRGCPELSKDMRRSELEVGGWSGEYSTPTESHTQKEEGWGAFHRPVIRLVWLGLRLKLTSTRE